MNKVYLQTKKTQNIYFTFCQKHNKKFCLSERGFCGKRKKIKSNLINESETGVITQYIIKENKNNKLEFFHP